MKILIVYLCVGESLKTISFVYANFRLKLRLLILTTIKNTVNGIFYCAGIGVINVDLS